MIALAEKLIKFTGWEISSNIFLRERIIQDILLFNFIDPDFAVLLKDATIQKMFVQLEELPESNPMYGVMETLIEQTEKEDIYSISNLASAFFYSIFFHIIFSLIIAAFVKKDKPIEISE